MNTRLSECIILSFTRPTDMIGLAVQRLTRLDRNRLYQHRTSPGRSQGEPCQANTEADAPHPLQRQADPTGQANCKLPDIGKLDRVSLALLGLCLFAEVLFLMKAWSIERVLGVYDQLRLPRSGAVWLVALVLHLLPHLLVLVTELLVVKAFRMQRPGRSMLINAVKAAALFVLPFVLLAVTNRALLNVVRQLGG